MIRIAKILSILFHPLMMPLLATLAFYFVFPTIRNLADPGHLRVILLLVFVCTVLMPLFSIFIMLRFGKISSVYMDDQQERNWPLLQTAIVYAGAFYALKVKAVPAFIPAFILGAMISMVLAMLINLKWKISLHMIGIGGLCGGVSAAYLILGEGNPLWLSLTFFLAGCIGTSRLVLRAHDLPQLAGGMVLGYFSEFILIMALR